MALDGLIFDLDGTLVDTNAMHVEAWRIALERFGYRIAEDRIAAELGKGGDKLVPDLLGDAADKKDGDGLRAEQPKVFGKLADGRGIKTYPGAVELLDECRRRGLKTALATSSNKKQLELAERASKVKWSEKVDVVVDADDIEESKPSPDVIHAAVKKLKLSPAQCAMVGDRPFDAESSVQGGVVCIGLMTSVKSPEVMRGAGARVVYRDVGELRENLDDAVRIVSPGSAHLTYDVLERLMREALAAAEEGVKSGEAPIGSAIATGDGRVVARTHNRLNATNNPTAHAEMVAFAAAAGKASADTRDLVLVSTLEPCVMCTGAAMVAAIDTIVYGLKAPADSGTGRVRPPTSPESQMPRIVGDILAAESRRLFQQWLDSGGNGNKRQLAYVRQLLQLNERRGQT